MRPNAAQRVSFALFEAAKDKLEATADAAESKVADLEQQREANAKAIEHAQEQQIELAQRQEEIQDRSTVGNVVHAVGGFFGINSREGESLNERVELLQADEDRLAAESTRLDFELQAVGADVAKASRDLNLAESSLSNNVKKDHAGRQGRGNGNMAGVSAVQGQQAVASDVADAKRTQALEGGRAKLGEVEASSQARYDAQAEAVEASKKGSVFGRLTRNLFSGYGLATGMNSGLTLAALNPVGGLISTVATVAQMGVTTAAVVESGGYFVGSAVEGKFDGDADLKRLEAEGESLAIEASEAQLADAQQVVAEAAASSEDMNAAIIDLEARTLRG